MTRDEFIDGYMKGRGVDPLFRTSDGYKEPDHGTRFAQKCGCGAPDCLGWTMEYADDDSGYLAILARMKATGRQNPG